MDRITGVSSLPLTFTLTPPADGAGGATVVDSKGNAIDQPGESAGQAIAESLGYSMHDTMGRDMAAEINNLITLTGASRERKFWPPSMSTFFTL